MWKPIRWPGLQMEVPDPDPVGLRDQAAADLAVAGALAELAAEVRWPGGRGLRPVAGVMGLDMIILSLWLSGRQGRADRPKPVCAVTCWAVKAARTALPARLRSRRETSQEVTNASGTENKAGLS